MLTDRPKQRLHGIIIVTAGVLIISFDALLVRLAAVDGWTVAFWRGLLMALSMYLIGRRRSAGIQSGPKYKIELITGVLFAISGLTLVLAFTLTTAANAVVILSSSPLFAAISSQIFLREKCPLRTWLSIFVCIGGILWVMSGSLGNSNYIGDILAISSAMSFGIYLTIFRKYPNLSRVRVITIGALIMALISFPLATPLHLPWMSYGWLIVSGLIQIPLSILLITVATRYLPAAEVSLFLLLETVMAPVWVWLVLREIPHVKTFLGGGLILLTLILHSLLGFLISNQIRPDSKP